MECRLCVWGKQTKKNDNEIFKRNHTDEDGGGGGGGCVPSPLGFSSFPMFVVFVVVSLCMCVCV